jgi:hypothetical protein
LPTEEDEELLAVLAARCNGEETVMLAFLTQLNLSMMGLLCRATLMDVCVPLEEEEEV